MTPLSALQCGILVGTSFAANLFLCGGVALFVASRFAGHPHDFPLFVLALITFGIGAVLAFAMGLMAAIYRSRLRRGKTVMCIEPLLLALAVALLCVLS